MYYFKNDDSEFQTISLYPAVNGKISDKAIIKYISKIITNHADIIYYLDRANRIRQFNLSTKVETKLFDKTLDKNSLFVYGRKVFMLTNNGGDSNVKRNIVVLDLIAGTVNTILENAKSIQSLTGNKLVFTAAKKVKEGERTVSSGVCTYVINVDTLSLVEIGSQKLTIEGFVGNSVVYTQVAPNNFNRSLYIKPLQADEPEQLIEQNIYQFCSIIAGKLFYYINDSSRLVKVRMDGSNMQTLCEDVETVLSVQEDKIIFISIDDKITNHVFEQATVKTVKSIYAVDFSGSGKIKLAYNIKTAQEYDEDTVYYIAASEVKATDELPGSIDTLYKLDVETNYVEKLLDIKVVQEKTKSSGFMVAMIIMAIAFFFALIGMVSNTPGIGALGFIVGFISLIIGCCIKAKEKEE